MGGLRNRQGVTLLELIAVVSLAAVLAGIAVLAYSRMVEDLRLNQAARQVMLDLVAARAQALAQSVGRRVLFLTEDNVYQPQRQTSGRYENDGGVIPLSAGIDLTACTAAGAAVTFRPRGNAVTFGTITLRSSSGRERRVVIDIAGRVRVE